VFCTPLFVVLVFVLVLEFVLAGWFRCVCGGACVCVEVFELVAGLVVLLVFAGVPEEPQAVSASARSSATTAKASVQRRCEPVIKCIRISYKMYLRNGFQ